MRNHQTFYIIFGFVVAVIVLPSLVFMIKLDGIKSLFRLIFKNKKSVNTPFICTAFENGKEPFKF